MFRPVVQQSSGWRYKNTIVVIMTHLITTVYLYHHFEDGWTTGQTFWCTYYEWKYIIKLKCFWWLFIHFISVLQIQSLCIYCTKAGKKRIFDLSPTNTILLYFISLYCFFIRAISKLYICIPTNCTQLIYFINNTLKHMYCLKL